VELSSMAAAETEVVVHVVSPIDVGDGAAFLVGVGVVGDGMERFDGTIGSALPFLQFFGAAGVGGAAGSACAAGGPGTTP